jgi:dephospho-CoA kinase
MKKHDKIEILDEIERIEADTDDLLWEITITSNPAKRKDYASIIEQNDYKIAELHKILNEETCP